MDFVHRMSTPELAGWICLGSRASSYYLFVIVAVIRHETTASTGWAPLLFVGAFFNNPIAIAIRAGLHACLPGRERVSSSLWALSQKQSLRSLMCPRPIRSILVPPLTKEKMIAARDRINGAGVCGRCRTSNTKLRYPIKELPR